MTSWRATTSARLLVYVDLVLLLWRLGSRCDTLFYSWTRQDLA
jgi:hypothetical protein